MADLATLAALGGLIVPVYVALWQMRETLGRIDKATDHNEKAIEDISSKVDRVEYAVVRDPDIELSPDS